MKTCIFKHILSPGTGCHTYLLLSAKAGNRLPQICVREYVFKVALTLICVKVRFL